MVSGVRRMNEVNARRDRLVPGWVTVFGRVYHGFTGPYRLRGETPKFKFLILVLHMYCLLVYTYVYLCCVRFSFFHTETRDWLGETSPKWSIMCRLKRKTTTQSINQSIKYQQLHRVRLVVFFSSYGNSQNLITEIGG